MKTDVLWLYEIEKNLCKLSTKLRASTLSEEKKELFDERAGILEFDGGFSREEAERMALKWLEGIKKGKG